MATNNTRDEMLAQGFPKGAPAGAPLITDDPRISRRRLLSTFDLYAADGSYLGAASGFSAQAVSDEWFRVHGEVAHLIEELD